VVQPAQHHLSAPPARLLRDLLADPWDQMDRSRRCHPSAPVRLVHRRRRGMRVVANRRWGATTRCLPLWRRTRNHSARQRRPVCSSWSMTTRRASSDPSRQRSPVRPEHLGPLVPDLPSGQQNPADPVRPRDPRDRLGQLLRDHLWHPVLLGIPVVRPDLAGPALLYSQVFRSSMLRFRRRTSAPQLPISCPKGPVDDRLRATRIARVHSFTSV
jgi:hypothetical protein